MHRESCSDQHGLLRERSANFTRERKRERGKEGYDLLADGQYSEHSPNCINTTSHTHTHTHTIVLCILH